MKIAFDENMPAVMVRTLQTIAADKGFRRLFRNIQMVRSKDYNPKPGDDDYVRGRGSDASWIRRYKKDGGRVIISGNTKMPSVPQELLAIQDTGMVVFFFPEVWNGWRFFRKSAFLMSWMERLLEQSRQAKPGAMFRLATDWSDDAPMLVIKPPTPLRLPEREQPIQPAARRKAAPRKRKPIREHAPGLFDYKPKNEKE